MWDERSGEVGGDCAALEDRIGTNWDENVWDKLQARKPVLSQIILWASTQTQAHGFGSKGPELILQKPGMNTYAPLQRSLHWLLYLPSDQSKGSRTPKLKFLQAGKVKQWSRPRVRQKGVAGTVAKSRTHLPLKVGQLLAPAHCCQAERPAQHGSHPWYFKRNPRNLDFYLISLLFLKFGNQLHF